MTAHIVPGHCLETADDVRYIRNGGPVRVNFNGEWHLDYTNVKLLLDDKPIIIIAANEQTTFIVSIDIVGWMYYNDDK